MTTNLQDFKGYLDDGQGGLIYVDNDTLGGYNLNGEANAYFCLAPHRVWRFSNEEVIRMKRIKKACALAREKQK